MLIDVAGNGILDLILSGPTGSGATGRDWLLINDGTGNFELHGTQLPPRYLGVDGATVAFAQGDFNRNGFTDILAVTVDAREGSYYQTSELHLWLNQGDGSFTDASAQIANRQLTGWPEWIRVADFDGDGHLDFLITSPGNPEQNCSGSAQIFLNDSTASFVRASVTLQDSMGSYQDDCLWFDRGMNTQNERFVGYTLDALPADLNNSGLPDLVASSLEAAWPVFLNRSSPGQLVFDVVFNGGELRLSPCPDDPEQQCASLDPFSNAGAGIWKNGALADINGNGRMDLVAANSISGFPDRLTPVVIWHGQDDGKFELYGGAGSDNCLNDPAESGRCGSTFSLADYPDRVGVQHARQWLVADFNKDGFEDVLILDHGFDASPFPGRQNLLLLGQANGGMQDGTAEWLSGNSTFTHGGAVGDLTQNGWPDIVKNNYVNGDMTGQFTQYDNHPKLNLNTGLPPMTAED